MLLNLCSYSGAVEISSVMSVDAFVTKTGLKMLSSLHSSTSVRGKIELTEGRVLSAEWDTPQDKMEIFDARYAEVIPF
jgi:hypothetical protein